MTGMDFTKVENIIFTAVAGALALFLFIMTFYLISKGHRRTSGLDIFLRVFSIAVLVVCAALIVLAVFTELTGSFRIDTTDGNAALVNGESVTELPLDALFVTLSTETGQTIVGGVFFIALITLVGDFLSAKKKYGKSAKAKGGKTKKSPEELKRDAELEKIRRLSDAAVKKSNAAAASSADKASATADEQPAESAPEKDAADEEDFDWRVDTPVKKTEEFVGLANADEHDDAFDSFDSFDDIDDSSAPSDDGNSADAEEYAEPEVAAAETAATEEPEQAQEQERHWWDDPVGDSAEDQDISAADAHAADAENDDAFADDPKYDEVADEAPDAFNNADAYIDDGFTLQEQPQDSYDSGEHDEYKSDAAPDEVEPDRAIYIPVIRTVTRTMRKPQPQAKKPAQKKPASTAKKPAANKTASTGKAAADKPAAKKPSTAAKKPAARKTAPTEKAVTDKSAVKKPSEKKTEPVKKQGQGKREAAATVDPKKLPVTKRYVILDRTNAVNIFSSYLKERNGADRDKLESSIDTIIIK